MSGEQAKPARVVACPTCGAATAYDPANPWRPFCSQRCRSIDLGAWASESYRIPLREGDPGAALPDEGEGPDGDPNTPGS